LAQAAADHGRVAVAVRVEVGQEDRQEEKDPAHPRRELDQETRRRADERLDHPGGERGAKPFAARPLQQHHQHEQEADDHENRQQEIDQQIHKRERAANLAHRCGVVKHSAPRAKGVVPGRIS
jgi:hypothetical protein